MNRPVRWSPEALDDFAVQIGFIADDNPAAARRVAMQIRRICAGLGQMTTGRLGRVSGTYEKLVAGLPYVVAYAIASQAGRENIWILRVIHSARDWPDEGWPR